MVVRLSILVLLSMVSCQKISNPKGDSQNTSDLKNEAMSEDTAIRYLALGDSYTIGEGVVEDERWPNQLSARFESINLRIDTTKIIAQTGWTTNDLIQAIGTANPKDFNLVSLLIGVNNQYQKLPFETFQSEFIFLLNKSIELAGSSERVFVVSIPDYGVTPFGSSNREKIAEELDMYNAYILAQCKEKSIPYINITGISRQLGDSEGALAPDNLHPSGFQYAKWVEKILPEVKKLLSK